MVGHERSARSARGASAPGSDRTPSGRFDVPQDLRVEGLAECTVYSIPLKDIDLTDETYRFRADLRIGPLARSIKADGIQIPVILRTVEGRDDRYQVISGFRRLTAALHLGMAVVPAIVRELTDDQAFRVCVLENSSRKTYSDIDRALALRAFRERGLGDDGDAFSLLGLTRRQQRNILSLLTLSRSLQAAIDDPQQALTASHGLALRQAAGKFEDLVPEAWVGRVNAGLSVAQLKRAINRKYAAARCDAGFSTLFRARETDASRGVFRLNPVRIDTDELTPAEKRALRAELEQLLASL